MSPVRRILCYYPWLSLEETRASTSRRDRPPRQSIGTLAWPQPVAQEFSPGEVSGRRHRIKLLNLSTSRSRRRKAESHGHCFTYRERRTPSKNARCSRVTDAPTAPETLPGLEPRILTPRLENRIQPKAPASARGRGRWTYRICPPHGNVITCALSGFEDFKLCIGQGLPFRLETSLIIRTDSIPLSITVDNELLLWNFT